MEFSGQRIYLGRWGDASTKEAYERTVAEWLSNRRTIPVDRQQITVTELYRDYWVYCDVHRPKSSPETI